MARLIDEFNHWILTISSAGGGGSSSGGGGGGGGGGGSSSSYSGGSGGGDSGPFGAFIIPFILLITIFGSIASFLAAMLSQRIRTVESIRTLRRVALIVMIIVAIPMVAYSTHTYVDEIGEERHEECQKSNYSSSCRSEEQAKASDYVIGVLGGVISAALGVAACYRIIKLMTDDSMRVVKSRQKMLKRLASAAQKDPIWTQDYLVHGATNVFISYQRDWSTLNTDQMKAYLTPRYYEHASLMIEAFRDAHRCNRTEIIGPINVNIEEFDDRKDDSQDWFEAQITARVNDILIDTDTNQTMTESRYMLDETWRFYRVGDSWCLDRINPSTIAEGTKAWKIQYFADQNGAFYSLDWGRMLLPTRGQIFNRSSFKQADVNNHVIGRMKSTGRIYRDDVVYQIYTYSAKPFYESTSKEIYLVGQLAVPKRYGNILIARRSVFKSPAKHGRIEVSLESSEFNNKYRVLADSVEQVTSFELLHPAMMQVLIDAPFEINIEVIDNIIYFYALLRNTNADNYAAMLSILQAAYRELKL